MSLFSRQTVAQIDLAALKANVRALKSLCKNGQEIMAVVKADAYGHGAIACARALELVGVKKLAVATVEEGIVLRGAGIRGEIVVLGGVLTENVSLFFENRLRPVIHCVSDLEKLVNYIKNHSREIAIHLKIDTGMGRLGVLPEELERVIYLLRGNTEIKLDGVMTHLACADEPQNEMNNRQIALFQEIKQRLLGEGILFKASHVANSAALLQQLGESETMVRPGLSLYGISPLKNSPVELKPVLRLVTNIMSIKRLPMGSTIGYGATYQTARESKIAVLPIGYADGYSRFLSKGGRVLIGGHFCPVVGRVSMDWVTVDITDVLDAKVGDEVVLIGGQEESSICVEELAAIQNTIPYEVLCHISARVPRLYLNV